MHPEIEPKAQQSLLSLSKEKNYLSPVNLSNLA